MAPSQGDRVRRAWWAALAVVVTYLVLTAAAGAWVHGETWDFQAHARDPLDGTWRLELAWLANRGAWSGVDFHYPRGPLWQLVGGAAYALSHGDVGWTHALYGLLFQLLSLAVIGAFVRARARSLPMAVMGFATLATLSTVVGTATLRALLPLMVIDAAVRSDGERRGPARVALWVCVGALVSFDRLVAMLLSVTAISVAELAGGLVNRVSVREWLARQSRLALALLTGGGVLAAGLLVAGGDPWTELTMQLRIARDYSGRMAMGWSAPVSGWAVAAFVLACLGLALARRRERLAETDSAWLLMIGALPAAAFGVIRADEEHLVLASLPLVSVLCVTALGAFPDEPRWRRLAAGGLFAVAASAIFVSRPQAVAGSPQVFRDAAAVMSGARSPNPDWRSDDAAAVAYARRVREAGRCIGTSADLTVVHPMADIRGPTELSLRWSPQRKSEIAAAIAAADCPHFVYSLLTYEWAGTNWILGPDFVEVARRYELDRQVGTSVLGLRKRQTLRGIERARIGRGQGAWTASIPGEVRIPLGAVIEGTDIVEVPLRVDLPGWRMRLGGAPVVEWRFERGGRALSGWVPMPDVVFNAWSSVQLSPDPAATEWLWMAGRSPSRHRTADTLALRLRPRGLSTPDTVELTVRPIDRLRLPGAATPRRACDASLDLLSQLREGAAFGRYFAPDVQTDRFSLEPNRPDDYEAEISFPVVPCADSCLTFGAMVEAPAEESDGVELGVHVFDPPRRTALHYEVIQPGGAPQEITLPLGAYEGREVMLQLRPSPWREWGGDAARIFEPRVTPCASTEP